MRARNILGAASILAVLALPASGSPDSHHDNSPAHAPAKPAPAKPAPAKVATKAAPPASGGHGSVANGAASTPSAGTATPGGAKASEGDAAPTADEALKMLTDGNERWVRALSKNPNTDPARRADVADNGQHPFATILTCADSRLPVERMFDRGVGDLFVLRVAGNVIGDELTGTIEYGTGHLKTPVIVVMGHTKCGAVAATLAGGEIHGKVATIVQEIQPAVDRARKQNPGADKDEMLGACVRENVWQTVYSLLKTSPSVRDAVAAGEVKIVGAVADISTGKVEFLGEHPWQSQLISSLKGAPAADAHGEAPSAEAAAPEAKSEHH